MNFNFEEQVVKFATDSECFYEENMEVLKGFTVAVDAELLLRKVRKANPLKSLQEGHAALDKTVQLELVQIIQAFQQKYEIKLVVVLQGLSPVCAQQEHDALRKSHDVWSKVENHRDQMELYNEILQQYGAKFYQQELIKAAKLTKSTFLVAPYLISTQLVELFQSKLVHCVFGSVKLLAYKSCNQVVVDFNLAESKFSFIDRQELNKKLQFDLNETNWATICAAQGSLFNIRHNQQPNLPFDQILAQFKDHKDTKFLQIRSLMLSDSGLVLNAKRELQTLSGKAPSHINAAGSVYGIIFNSDVYYMLSQGLLDYQVLETVSTRQNIMEVVLAPSSPIKEVWDQPQFTDLYSFICSNLQEKKDFKDSKEILKVFNKNAQPEAHIHSLWNFSEADIVKEMGRLSMDNVSFYLVMRWFQRASTPNQKKTDSLLEFVIDQKSKNDKKPAQLQTENELMTMCYFQYLSQNKYLSIDDEYLYGNLLPTAGQDFSEPVLVFLEMLKVFYPCGQKFMIPETHKPFNTKYGKEANESVLLLSRLFSLIPWDSKNFELTQDQIDYDLAAFNSYANLFKQSLSFIFQTSQYRLFRSERASVDILKQWSAVEMLAFQKDENHSLGLVLKQIMTCNGNLDSKLKSDEIKKGLLQGAKFWKIVYKINRVAADHEEKELNKQFEKANEVFAQTMKQHGFEDVVSELQRN